MSRDTATDEGIRRTARWLRTAIFAATGTFAFVYLLARLGIGFGPLRVEYRTHEIGLAYGQVFADGTMLLLAVALVRLIQMLGLIAAGELFSVGVVRRFRSFAFWLMLTAVLGVLGPLAVGFLTSRAGDAHRLEFTFQLREFLLLGLTLVLFLIARLLERARLLEAEMREIV